ncbi:hypothetical protein [Spiroplasma poulsonii]|uniref:hypothetical protein n=1 Tax=Spiroplasma poulsonii TaxID=2138 RepID=UPI001F4CA1DB|nr:hypothetical protein [Spiroplasma poulsonii]UNF61230.1 hypothetical protein MNU24_04765 [Spiroplasma poulsonii]
MLPKTPIQRPKKRQKQSYSGKKETHDSKTQVIIEQETKKKNYCNKFFAQKNMIMLLFKESKSHFKKYQINSW